MASGVSAAMTGIERTPAMNNSMAFMGFPFPPLGGKEASLLYSNVRAHVI